jgi:hypothetical protein
MGIKDMTMQAKEPSNVIRPEENNILHAFSIYNPLSYYKAMQQAI